MKYVKIQQYIHLKEKNYEICAACASRLNAGDIENSIKAIQEEAAILAEKEQKEKRRKLQERNLKKL